MTKVITYGTYDLLHCGHIRLLERAKALGDYLIVGVTGDDFDKSRGKINVQQSLMERVEAVRSTGIADEIIIEEYEGQKIDDIRRMEVDIFTVGSDWEGKFDYLNEYCKVIYLPRTEGVSSSEIRSQKRKIRLGLVGEERILLKFLRESKYVNGVSVVGVCSPNVDQISDELMGLEIVTCEYGKLLDQVDAVYIVSHPLMHYEQIKMAIKRGKHVLCESPIAMTLERCKELLLMAKKNECILREAIKTAYSTAYSRLLLLAKGGQIGKVMSVDVTCTSLKKINYNNSSWMVNTWNSMCAWGPTAMLPIFQLLGVDYQKKQIISCMVDKNSKFDLFSKGEFIYSDAVASLKVGKGIKSEGELIISGTEGYIYVPAPWWKTDYFELRYENPENNKRYFYQLEGEGIRYEIVNFIRSIETKNEDIYIGEEITEAIVKVIEDYNNEKDLLLLSK